MVIINAMSTVSIILDMEHAEDTKVVSWRIFSFLLS